MFSGELLSIDGPVRPWRHGLLAQELCARGHQVTRWAPTFVHALKTQRAERDTTRQISDRYAVELLYAPGYHRHIGLARLRFNHRIARAFSRRALGMESPDLILSGMPTPELCAAVARFAGARGIPFVIDVRDLWPDIYLEAVPAWLRPLGGVVLWPYARMNQSSFSQATGITAISASYLHWGLEYAGRDPDWSDRVFYMGYPRLSVSPAEHTAAVARWVARGVRPGHFICCFFGSMNHQFDCETILSAARRILQSTDDRVQFVLCGHAEPAVEAAIRAAGLPNVLMPGWVDAEDITVLMHMAQAGLAPYRSSPKISGTLHLGHYPITRIGGKATISNKCLEYLSGGLPVLTSLMGEFEQVVKEYDCGLTYADGDVNGLLEALDMLRRNPERARTMGRNGSEVFASRFSAARIYPEMANHLEELAARPVGRREAAGRG